MSAEWQRSCIFHTALVSIARIQVSGLTVDRPGPVDVTLDFVINFTSLFNNLLTILLTLSFEISFDRPQKDTFCSLHDGITQWMNVILRQPLFS